MTTTGEVLKPTQSEWESLAACMYQAAGAYDMPVRFLDALSAAQSGEPFAHLLPTLLPVHAPQGNAAQVPDGYVLVPVEPTSAMIKAGVAHNDGIVSSVYKAMLLAAPSNKEVER